MPAKEMKIKLSEIEIPSDSPFVHDRLSRKESAEVLTQFVRNTNESFVLAIDSPWGTGKTTFIRMWIAFLKKEGFQCLYFNAWQNDFSSDPFISLIGEIGSMIKVNPTSNKIYKKGKKIGAELVRRTIPVAVKIATAGVLDLDKFSEEALAKLTERIAADKIAEHEKTKLTVEEFRKELADFVASLSKTQDENKRKSFIFVIDELDRCRPTFAIQLLEKVKHLFNVDGIIFVLALDKEQLALSLQTVYGQGMDVDGYLRRFIDLEYHLPEPPKGLYASVLFDRFSIHENLGGRKIGNANLEREDLDKMFSELFHLFQLSLHDQEHCFAQLSIVYKTTPSNHKVFPVLLSLLIALRMKNFSLYRRFVHEDASPDDVIKYLRGLPRSKEIFDVQLGSIIIAELIVAKGDQTEIEKFRTHYSGLITNTNTPSPERETAKDILNFLNRWSGDTHFNKAKHLSGKIEIAEKFS
ncbi:MAG: hypothetical protein HYY49_01125 [Ignavibacteriales bacterium]|nr:hypothetical protein [Ignavibacteriales bacterium]